MDEWKDRKRHLLATVEKIDKYLYRNVSIFLYFDWCDLKIMLIELLKEQEKEIIK